MLFYDKFGLCSMEDGDGVDEIVITIILSDFSHHYTLPILCELEITPFLQIIVLIKLQYLQSSLQLFHPFIVYLYLDLFQIIIASFNVLHLLFIIILIFIFQSIFNLYLLYLDSNIIIFWMVRSKNWGMPILFNYYPFIVLFFYLFEYLSICLIFMEIEVEQYSLKGFKIDQIQHRYSKFTQSSVVIVTISELYFYFEKSAFKFHIIIVTQFIFLLSQRSQLTLINTLSFFAYYCFDLLSCRADGDYKDKNDSQKGYLSQMHIYDYNKSMS